MGTEIEQTDNEPLKIIQEDGSINIELLMNILGNEIDRKILMKLSKTPSIATNLSKDLGISKPAIKKHLENLLQVGLIIPYSKDERDKKKVFYCLNPEISLSLNLDFSLNYFNYSVKNVSQATQDVYKRLEKKKSKYPLQVSIYGVKKDAEDSIELAERRAQNAALIQLGRALRTIELNLRSVEQDRENLFAEKKEITTRIKEVISNFVDEPLEREIIFSFFYRLFESLDSGISVNKFLEDIYLRYKGSRAGVSEKDITRSMINQRNRIKEIKATLMRIVNEISFIKTLYDKDSQEMNIFFDF
ncbi:MAG: ArsR family transcriptional regulator [Candidatus Lokiarchaeota archaeon]|nr:ArsR family transcriptional regulator [Candidatus Lokiarchaeota archaeon]